MRRRCYHSVNPMGAIASERHFDAWLRVHDRAATADQTEECESSSNNILKLLEGRHQALPSPRHLVLRKHEIGVVAIAGILKQIRLCKRSGTDVGFHAVEGQFFFNLAAINQVFQKRLCSVSASKLEPYFGRGCP